MIGSGGRPGRASRSTASVPSTSGLGPFTLWVHRPQSTSVGRYAIVVNAMNAPVSRGTSSSSRVAATSCAQSAPRGPAVSVNPR